MKNLSKVLFYLCVSCSLLYYLFYENKKDFENSSVSQDELKIPDFSIIDNVFVDHRINYITLAVIDASCVNSAHLIDSIQKSFDTKKEKSETKLVFLIIGTPDFYVENILSNPKYVGYPVIKAYNFDFYQNNSQTNDENKMYLFGRDYKIIHNKI